MDFFEYAQFAFLFVNSDAAIWVPLLVGALCFAIVYTFQSAALYIIGGREGYKHRWMAFIPFFNTYYIGVCAQKNRVFRQFDTKKIAIVTAVLEFVLFIGNLIYYIAFYMLLAGNYLEWVPYETYYGIVEKLEIVSSGLPAGLLWAGWCYKYLNEWILRFVNLIFIVFEVLVLSAFFQTYAARRYFLFTVTSILFPIQGILFFVLRNNKGMSYADFIRGEQERQYRMYQQYRQQNYDRNPYNQNPYSRNPYDNGNMYNGQNGAPRSDDGTDPFGEQNGNNPPDDPFDDLK